MSKEFIAIATLIGTMIGAGILGLPYVIMQSGFPTGLVMLVFLCLILMLIHLYIGEISLRTKGYHHLSGQAEKYLGKKAKLFVFFASAFGIFSALTAYLIGESQSLSHILFNSQSPAIYLGFAFWILFTVISYFGLEALEDSEKFAVPVIILLIVIISFAFISKINPSNLLYTNTENTFVPFGVIMFSFLAFSAVPELKRVLKKDSKKLKPTIIISSLVVLAVYIIFTAIVLGSQGQNTPEIATFALGKVFIVLGMLTMFTAYLSLAIAIRDTMRFDFGFSRKKAWFITSIVPLILFIPLTLLNSNSFTNIISLGGIVSGCLVGITALFIIKKAKENPERNPEYSIPYSNILTIIIIVILALGTFFEIINVLF